MYFVVQRFRSTVQANTQSKFTASYVQVIIVGLHLASINKFLMNYAPTPLFLCRNIQMLVMTIYHQILGSMHLQ